MTVDVKVPSFPESVSDGTIVAWHKQVGDAVKQDEVIADIETDKVVFELPAPSDGVLTEIMQGEGSVVLSQQVIAKVDETATPVAKVAPSVVEAKPESQETAPQAAIPDIQEKSAIDTQEPSLRANPAARKAALEDNVDLAKVSGSGRGGRILKEDVKHHIVGGIRPEERVPMTRLRQRIAERLVEAQHTAAMLTTFNEINMKPVMDVRAKYKDQFEKAHDTKLGFMSFFVKAAVEALKKFPAINASIDGSDIVYHGFFDIGIAVSTPRGLVVPVLRDAENMSLADIEATIREYGMKARENKLAMEEITGGTFSITNGGVFGSMLSTPILNPPQSAILGMHNIVDRPVAENGEVVIRPVMYVALTYDHRIVDGREAVQFLVSIKNSLEDPVRMLLDL